VSCVCGVAMRENDAILVADMCHNDTALLDDVKYLTYSAKHLSADAGIKVSDSGNTFKACNITMSLLHNVARTDSIFLKYVIVYVEIL